MNLLDRLRRHLDARLAGPPNGNDDAARTSATVDAVPAGSSYLTSEHFYDMTEEPADHIDGHNE